MTISSGLHTYVGALAMALPLMLAPLAEATTIDCGAGDVQCLLAAIGQANADPQHKTTIRLAGGTYALSTIDNDTNGPNGLPSIVSPVTIDGGSIGAILTRLAGALVRILHVGASGRLTLHGVTISHGFGNDGSGLFNDGGVVTVVESSFIENGSSALHNNHGVVSIIDSIFRDHSGSGPPVVSIAGGVLDITRTVFENNRGDGGGGVWSLDTDLRITASRFSGGAAVLGVGGVRVSGGKAAIIQTTFAHNAGDGGGGIVVGPQSTVIVRESAFLENAGLLSAAITNFGGSIDVINTTFGRNITCCESGTVSNVSGRMTIINSTFAENTTGAGVTSVIASGSGATTLLQNTIVVHNGDDQFPLCTGVITSLGHNLIGDSSCIVAPQLGDLIGADAVLDQLVDDGAPGNAHFPLLSDSQAIDVANDAACPKKDQIGRPRQPHCDIGAVEFRRSDVTAATE